MGARLYFRNISRTWPGAVLGVLPCSIEGARWDGGYHFKFYELEDGIVCIQAHEDTSVLGGGSFGHSVDSYQTAIDEAVDVLTDAGGDENGSKDLSNESKDYDGNAPIVEDDRDSINKTGC